MNIKEFFHKIKILFSRFFGYSIPKTTQAKMYGSMGEDDFFFKVKAILPDCLIKRNVVIQTIEGNAEIDCMILYDDKIFAIEIKRWKGDLIQQNDKFIQKKIDRWTNEIHKKIHKSPFRQLSRAIYLLKKQIPGNPWINTIVFFEDTDYIEINDENLWFDNIDNLIEYIINCGEKTNSSIAKKFFDKCIPADCLYASSFRKWLNCIICDESVCFQTSTKLLTRNEIKVIKIKHHFLYDELLIITYDNVMYKIKCENGYVNVIENGNICKYSLSKIDFIELGGR